MWGGGVFVKYTAVWILNVLVDMTCRMEKQEPWQNSGLWSFICAVHADISSRTSHAQGY